MPKFTSDEIVTKVKHKRSFIQFGGPLPTQVLNYAGQDANAVVISGVSVPEFGAIDPIYIPSPSDSDAYKLVGRKLNTPDLPEATFTFLERHGSIPRQLQKIGCFNMYEYTGACKDLSDMISGWDDYVLIYSLAMVETKNLGDRSTWDADDQVEDELPAKLNDIYPIGKVSFEDNATSIITLEVIDVVFANPDSCADCGAINDGTNWLYAITTTSGTTPGTAPRLIYTVDGGGTWVQSSVTGLGDIETPAGIDVVGSRLVVYTRTAGGTTISGYYWSEINPKTGVPGAWTKVIAGFVATFQVYDMFVLSPREVFFSADGGYIYKSTDIASGVSVVSPGNATSTALRRISGRTDSDTLVAVGGSGNVVRSVDRGVTWATTVTFPVVATLQAVAVVSGDLWWVGAANGTLWYTLNGGETWVQKGFEGSGAGQIYDIVFLNDEVGWMSYSNATPTAQLFSTWVGGNFWTRAAPRIQNMITANRFNRIAYPKLTGNYGLSANTVALAGLAGNGSDGVLLLGTAPRL